MTTIIDFKRPNYGRAPNPVPGAGAIVYAGGTATIASTAGIPVLVSTIFDPDKGTVTARVEVDLAQLGTSADELHIMAVEAFRGQYRRQLHQG